MHLFSWNVNGIRAIHRKGAWEPFIERYRPDMLAIQETKASVEQIPQEIREQKGYYTYFASPTVKRGYSGVGLFVKQKPIRVEYGMGIKRLDDEGRLIAAYYENFILFNVYFPNGGGGPERLAYKLDFYDAFLAHIERLRAAGHSIIFCGDINTAHEEIDLARPKENETHTGFLPEERAWLDEVVAAGYIDTYRYFYPSKQGAYTYWDLKTRARERNVGWRIDYFFISPDLLPRLRSAHIHDSVLGSDHCPISIELDES